MMKTSHVLFAALAIAVGGSGCDQKPAVEKVGEATRQEDRAVAEAARQAQTKLNDAVKKANDVRADVSESLRRAKTEAKESTEKALAETDKKLTELRAKATQAGKISKNEADKAVTELQAKSAALRSRLVTIETATQESLVTWREAIKLELAKIDEAISDLAKRI